MKNHGIQAWLTDMDGVLVHEDEALPGAVEFIETLKEAGAYDACWVILTSDHGHHGFDLPHAQHRNVPFIVKPPGGDRARFVADPINLWELGPFFGRVFGGSDPAACLAALFPEGNPK